MRSAPPNKRDKHTPLTPALPPAPKPAVSFSSPNHCPQIWTRKVETQEKKPYMVNGVLSMIFLWERNDKIFSHAAGSRNYIESSWYKVRFFVKAKRKMTFASYFQASKQLVRWFQYHKIWASEKTNFTYIRSQFGDAKMHLNWFLVIT